MLRQRKARGNALVRAAGRKNAVRRAAADAAAPQHQRFGRKLSSSLALMMASAISSMEIRFDMAWARIEA